MKTKIVEVDGKPVIVGIDETGNIIAQHYKGETPKERPEGVKDKIELSAWIQGQGHKRGSAEYDKLFSELSEGLPLEHGRQ
jgi:hypothetical protein